jgi:hypothetical protein
VGGWGRPSEELLVPGLWMQGFWIEVSIYMLL